MSSRNDNSPSVFSQWIPLIVVGFLFISLVAVVGVLPASADEQKPAIVSSDDEKIDDSTLRDDLESDNREKTHEVIGPAQTETNESMNRLVINASGGQKRSFYSFEVSGVINPEKVNAHDSVSYRRAEGYVGTEGKDIYRFSGNITEFSFNGPARVYLNGVEVDPDSLSQGTVEVVQSSPEKPTNRLVMNASGGQKRSFYSFEVSGVINPEKVNAHDSVSYRRAEGYVGTEGKDIYRFSGNITEFSFNGPARVYLNGAEVNPESLLQSSTSTVSRTATVTSTPTGTSLSTATSAGTTTRTSAETSTMTPTVSTSERSTNRQASEPSTVTSTETRTSVSNRPLDTTQGGSGNQSGTTAGSGSGFGALAAVFAVLFTLLILKR